MDLVIIKTVTHLFHVEALIEYIPIDTITYIEPIAWEHVSIILEHEETLFISPIVFYLYFDNEISELYNIDGHENGIALEVNNDKPSYYVLTSDISEDCDTDSTNSQISLLNTDSINSPTSLPNTSPVELINSFKAPAAASKKDLYNDVDSDGTILVSPTSPNSSTSLSILKSSAENMEISLHVSPGNNYSKRSKSSSSLPGKRSKK